MGQKGRKDDGDTRRKRTPVFRATSSLSRGQLKSKGHGKLSIHYCADQEKIKTVIRTIASVNQLGLHGAVAEMCENTNLIPIERATRCGKTVEFLIRAKRDQDERAFE